MEVPALKQSRTSGVVVRVAQAPKDSAKGEPRYPVRIRVDNPNGKLRPGMTARAFLK